MLQDTKTTLYYLQSRYYDPGLGRFLNADAFASTGQGILGNNMFAYCLNNPVRYKDSQGYLAVEDGDSEEDPHGNNINDFTGAGKTKAPSSSAKGARYSGFRGALQKLTGQSGEGCDAHHIFPVKFSDLFEAIGININNPKYGAWWERSTHQQNSNIYNVCWDIFFRIEGVTKEDAFDFVEGLSSVFGFEFNR